MLLLLSIDDLCAKIFAEFTVEVAKWIEQIIDKNAVHKNRRSNIQWCLTDDYDVDHDKI